MIPSKLMQGTPMSNPIIQVSKITSNRQVTIPKEVMKRLKLKQGDKIVWIEQNNNIIIKKGKIVAED
jgi:antitoxin PrlF